MHDIMIVHCTSHFQTVLSPKAGRTGLLSCSLISAYHLYRLTAPKKLTLLWPHVTETAFQAF